MGSDMLNKLNLSSFSSLKFLILIGSSISLSLVLKVILYGKCFMGIFYVWGGVVFGGFDCSGYFNYVYCNVVGVSFFCIVVSIY